MTLRRLKEAFPEVGSLLSSHRFPGRGQRDTPVADIRAITLIIAMLPGKMASKFRRELLQNPECSNEYLDAEAILRERGCNKEQTSRLAGELGKDLWLVAKSEAREIPTTDKQFGLETRAVKQYHRLADAKLIDDVVESFRKRPLWHSVAGEDPKTLQRQHLLAEQGRGRKGRKT